jgi:hypothetical protein
VVVVFPLDHNAALVVGHLDGVNKLASGQFCNDALNVNG